MSTTQTYLPAIHQPPRRRLSSAVIVADDDMSDIRQSRLLSRLFMMLLALCGLALAIYGGGRLLGKSLTTGGHTESTEIHQITIGNNLLEVPSNIIRFSNQRRSGEHKRLDLYMRYPEMTGYTRETRDWFNDVAPDRRLVFVSFEEAQMSRDMSGRFAPIYASITRPSPLKPLAGLARYDFIATAGYASEELLVGPQDVNGVRFVVRCLTGPDAEMALTACERDIRVGDAMSATYRFPRSMLADWRYLEANVRAVANRIIGAGRS